MGQITASNVRIGSAELTVIALQEGKPRRTLNGNLTPARFRYIVPLLAHLSRSVTILVPDATGCCRLQALSPKVR